MNGGKHGIGGRPSGANGIPLPVYGLMAAIAIIVGTVNVSSKLMENPVGHRSFFVWEPMVWEASSALSLLALIPLMYWAYRRFHWRGGSLARIAGIHFACALFFSLSHVGLMVAMRHAAYHLMGGHYDFSRGHLWLELIYEARKDALTYVLFYAIFWMHERLQPLPATPLADARIEVKSDGRTYYLLPGEIIHIEAAGNYVELYHTHEANPLLLRDTLSHFEKRLEGSGVVRIHRSRLINRDHLRQIASTPSGDLRVTLSDGRIVIGSRRFRTQLDLV